MDININQYTNNNNYIVNKTDNTLQIEHKNINNYHGVICESETDILLKYEIAKKNNLEIIKMIHGNFNFIYKRKYENGKIIKEIRESIPNKNIN